MGKDGGGRLLDNGFGLASRIWFHNFIILDDANSIDILSNKKFAMN